MTSYNFSEFPTLQTDRLTLRKIEKTDADVILTLRSNPEMIKYLARPPIKSYKEASEIVDKILDIMDKGEGVSWALTLKQNPTLIGTIGVWKFDGKGQTEIGYELAPEYHGLGVMQEAFIPVLKYTKDVLKCNTIVATVDPNNMPSIKRLLANGFMKNKGFEETSEDGLKSHKYSLNL